ncbi:MAG: hypothetical protein ACRD7E_18880, partial [Bryobacteraceae bacterium]
MTTPPERPLRKPPVAILDSILGAMGLLIGIPQVRVGVSTADDHPGWNISDDFDLPARGECRYLIELVSSQTASIYVASTHPVAISVCDDDEYDSWAEGVFRLAPDSEVVSAVCNGLLEAIRFRALRTGAYDLIVNNPGGQSTHVAICITAPPARQAAKGPGRKTGMGRL